MTKKTKRMLIQLVIFIAIGIFVSSLFTQHKDARPATGSQPCGNTDPDQYTPGQIVGGCNSLPGGR